MDDLSTHRCRYRDYLTKTAERQPADQQDGSRLVPDSANEREHDEVLNLPQLMERLHGDLRTGKASA